MLGETCLSQGLLKGPPSPGVPHLVPTRLQYGGPG